MILIYRQKRYHHSTLYTPHFTLHKKDRSPKTREAAKSGRKTINYQLPIARNSAGSTGTSLQVTPKWTWAPNVLSTMAESDA